MLGTWSFESDALYLLVVFEMVDRRDFLTANRNIVEGQVHDFGIGCAPQYVGLTQHARSGDLDIFKHDA